MRYLNILKNQWLVSRAWMITSVMFMILSFFLAIKLIQASSVVPVRLIPYDFAANNGAITVTGDGLSDSKSYLTSIAISDISNYGSWTNRTIKTQYTRFTNRMHPSLYAQAGRVLLETADSKLKSEESQSLFIEKTSVDGDTVRVIGTLRLYQGSQITAEVKMRYDLTYTGVTGVPYLINFSAVPEKE